MDLPVLHMLRKIEKKDQKKKNTKLSLKENKWLMKEKK